MKFNFDITTALPGAQRYVLAFSGGLDSHVLLHLLAKQTASALKSKVLAVHVDHGLQNSSQAWAQHCVSTADALGIPCEVMQVQAAPAPGQSPEAAARQARYAALADWITPDSCLLTAHHQDDQAETLLLQLMRGAGPKGLASMPQQCSFAAGTHCRPLLTVSREQLHNYAMEHNLNWIEDSSNQDQTIDRNFIRQQVLPVLYKRWPQASTTVARSARNCAEHERLAQALAAIDLDGLLDPADNTLSISKLLSLSIERQANVLRYWISQHALPLPNRKRLRELLRQLATSANDRHPQLTWPGACLKSKRNSLAIFPG